MRREDQRTLMLLEEIAAVPLSTPPARRARMASMLRVLVGPGRARWVVPETVADLLAADAADVAEVSVRSRPAGPGQCEVGASANDLAVLLRRCELVDRRGMLLVGLPSSLVTATGARALGALSGLVLAGGVVSRSNRALYLQLHIPTLEAALAYARLARPFGVNLRIKDAPSTVAIVRDADMSALLDALGAVRARARLDAETSTTRMRRVGQPGMDSALTDANTDRSLQAARRMCEEVGQALAVLGPSAPDHLAYAGRLRLEHPDLSLEALGRQAEPPLSKDAIAGRLRRLLAMAGDRKAG